MKNLFFVAAAAFFLFSPEALAADCVADSCTNARIQALLVNWGDDPASTAPYSVKVRFDGLTGLSCNHQQAPWWEVRLMSTDKAFREKYSMLMTAFTTGKPVWFYVKSTGVSVPCEFGMVALRN